MGGKGSGDKISENSNHLQSAVEHLYREFAQYTLASRVVGCGHCVFEADIELLHSAPLRSLWPGDLEKYAHKAMTTWGTPDDFRHFLPRIFELISQRAQWHLLCLEIVFSKLQWGKWRTWPADEQQAIENFMTALWQDVLEKYPDPLDAGTLLCCIGQAADDLGPYLSRWQIDDSLPAALHFCDLVENNIDQFKTKRPERWKLYNAFWTDCPLAAQQVASWLLAPKRQESLESAFFKFSSDQETARVLSVAGQALSNLQAFVGQSSQWQP